MAYVGNTPSRGQWRKLTDISGSFNGVTTTFTTSVPPGTSEYYVTAGTASQLIISLGGVIQEPDIDYTVSTNSITFTTAPAAGLSFFGVLCGDALNTGVPSDGSVTTSKLGSNLTVDLASGSAATPSLTFDANTGVYSPGEDQVAISTGGSGRLFVDASGRLSLGTPTATSQLFLEHPTVSDFRQSVNAVLQTNIYASSSDVNIFSVQANPLRFGTNNTERLRITSAGLVGIGTSSPTGLLTVAATSPVIDWTNSSNTAFKHSIESTGYSGSAAGNTLAFKVASGSGTQATVMTLDGSGRVGIGTASPGELLSVNGNILITTANKIKTNDSGGNLTIQGGGTFPGGHIVLNGGNGSDNIIFNRSGASASSIETARIDSSGRLLVGTSSAGAGSVTTTAIVGSQLTKSTGFRTVSGSGTLDLDLSEGTGVAGHLYVSSTRQSNANVKTNAIYFISTRQGSNTAITLLNSNNGSTAGSSFTITNPSANVFRFTDTAAGGNITVSICFVGTITD